MDLRKMGVGGWWAGVMGIGKVAGSLDGCQMSLAWRDVFSGCSNE